MKTIFVNAFITLLLVIIIDMVAFIFLPDHYLTKFSEYRRDTRPEAGGRIAYPHGYFIEHERRGFDIGRNKSRTHWVNGISYPIWSNSLGCFDNEQDKYDDYVYFAGDSFTWGYTPFEQKFGAIIQETTGTRIFKCGVTHTGQLHQFEKLVDVVKEFGRPPKAVFVFYFSNDAANDYAHPHTIVIHGWQVDSVSLDENNELIEHSAQKLTDRVEHELDEIQKRKERIEKQSKSWREAKRILKYYSLSVNILVYVKGHIHEMANESSPVSEINSNTALKSFYSIPKEKNGRYWYSNNPFAQRNKTALISFDQFSNNHNSKFVVVIIPPKDKFNNTKWHRELTDFLTENKIRHIDLASKFKDKELTVRELYWVSDDHLNPAGNKIVAEILLDEFQDILLKNTKLAENI